MSAAKPARVLPVTPGALGLRVAVLVLAASALALVPHPPAALLAVSAVGALIAALLPASAGASVLLAGLLIGWAASYGTDAQPAILRTLGFALTVYLVHVATALAASVPVGAHVARDVMTAWARRSLPGAGVTVVAAALVTVLGRVPGSVGLDAVGVLAALVAAGATFWLVRLRD